MKKHIFFLFYGVKYQIENIGFVTIAHNCIFFINFPINNVISFLILFLFTHILLTKWLIDVNIYYIVLIVNTN